MKVFILVCDWAWGFAPDMDIALFDNLQDAKEQMRKESNEFKDTEAVMRKLDSQEIADTYVSFSEDGAWQENHIAWTIYERELNSPDKMVVSLCMDDLKDKGYDTSAIDDDQLQQIASKMGDYLLDGDYWCALELACDYYDIRKKGYNDD